MELGDVVEQALSVVGVTSQRIEYWLGVPCNCPERREKLNELSRWARRVVQGKVDRARDYLEEIIK